MRLDSFLQPHSEFVNKHRTLRKLLNTPSIPLLNDCMYGLKTGLDFERTLKAP